MQWIFNELSVVHLPEFNKFMTHDVNILTLMPSKTFCSGWIELDSFCEKSIYWNWKYECWVKDADSNECWYYVYNKTELNRSNSCRKTKKSEHCHFRIWIEKLDLPKQKAEVFQVNTN